MPRFVILEHDHPELHWDLMLETGDALRTWRLAAAPATGVDPIIATALADHRRAYLEYEGPVSGNRGQVRRWDTGTYEELRATGPALHMRLHGHKLNGTAELARVGEDWMFRFVGSAKP